MRHVHVPPRADEQDADSISASSPRTMNSAAPIQVTQCRPWRKEQAVTPRRSHVRLHAHVDWQAGTEVQPGRTGEQRTLEHENRRTGPPPDRGRRPLRRRIPSPGADATDLRDGPGTPVGAGAFRCTLADASPRDAVQQPLQAHRTPQAAGYSQHLVDAPALNHYSDEQFRQEPEKTFFRSGTRRGEEENAR